MLTSEKEDEVIAFCCTKSVSGVAQDDHKEMVRVAVQYTREEAEKDPMPMGCSAKQSEKHMNRIVDRAYERMQRDRASASQAKSVGSDGKACGFAFLAIFPFLSALWTIFSLIRQWMKSAPGEDA
jgi:hypothetical protein